MKQSKDYESFNDKIVRLYGGGVPKSVTIQLTEDCNLACSYCYQIKKSSKKLSLEKAKKFVDMVLWGRGGFEKYLDISKDKGIVFDFIGGEPFLEIELMDEITDYILTSMVEKKHPIFPHIMFSISTNGTLYFEPKVQEYLEKYKGFVSVSISVDGNEKLHDSCRIYPDGKGSYALAISAVKDWISKGNYMGSKMTICPENVQFLSEAVVTMLESYDEIHLNCVYEKGWTESHATTLYFELKKIADYLVSTGQADKYISMFNDFIGHPMKSSENENWCGGNGRMIAVDPDGKIYPCIRYMPSSLGDDQEPIVLGNVEDGILNTEKECKWNNCLKCITRRSQSTDECFDCPVASGCSWCTAYNYQETGDPNKRLTYHCMMHKATSLANVYYWNKRGVPFKMWLKKEDAVAIVGEEEYAVLNKLTEERLT